MYTRPLRPDELAHFGTKGMKWGVRRYQNEDGSLTPAGMQRYGRMEKKVGRLDRKNERLYKKVRKYELKSAKTRQKGERVHTFKDLGEYNLAASKVARNKKAAAKFDYKAHEFEKQGNLDKAYKYQMKAERRRKWAAGNQALADQKLLSTPYSKKAMKYIVKSDKIMRKANKAKQRIAKNKRLQNAMNTSMSQVYKQYNLQKAHEYYDKYERLKSRNYGKARKSLDKYVELEDKAYGVKSK